MLSVIAAMTTVEDTIVIDQITNSENSTLTISVKVPCIFTDTVFFIEDDTPTMRDLNRYVTKKYAADWKDTGIELGLELDVLNVIEKDHPQGCVTCFQVTLDKWIKSTPNATWKTLEVALTNVRRQQPGLDPVDNVCSGESFVIMKYLSLFSHF